MRNAVFPLKTFSFDPIQRCHLRSVNHLTIRIKWFPIITPSPSISGPQVIIPAFHFTKLGLFDNIVYHDNFDILPIICAMCNSYIFPYETTTFIVMWNLYFSVCFFRCIKSAAGCFTTVNFMISSLSWFFDVSDPLRFHLRSEYFALLTMKMFLTHIKVVENELALIANADAAQINSYSPP